jgi:hypothetical protein
MERKASAMTQSLNPMVRIKVLLNMSMEEKNTFSHRQKAVTQLFEFLRKQ